MFDELYPEAADTALAARINRPAEPQAPRFSAWRMLGAAPKGVVAGAAQAMGSTADMLGAYGSVMGTTGSGGGMFALPTEAERKQQNEATDQLLSSGPNYMSEGGRSLRNAAAFYTPDPVTTHAAEGAVFNLFRMGGKAITAAVTLGNIPGAIVAGAEEGFTMADELAQQGVDQGTRTQVGAVNALVNAAGFALPAAGKTWMQTGALALLGGPVSFVTQQAATREILQAADYTKQAEQYDPFDPVGLTLSTVIPLGFGALAMRGAKVRAKGPTPDAVPDVPPVPKVYPADELVDAARVSLVRQHMDSTNPAPGDLAAADAHIAAHAQALEQMAAGERVSVADVAPKPVAAVDTPNFKAWFGDSKVVGSDGAPMVVYHGTASSFDAFDSGKAGAAIDSGKLGEGFYFSQDNRWAASYANNAAKNGGASNVLPVFISLKNPLVLDGSGTYLQKLDAISKEWGIQTKPALDEDQTPNAAWSKEFTAAAHDKGFDGVILPSKIGQTEYVVFNNKQIKSAIGNSGKFDPRSASLTDPITNWGAGLNKALGEMLDVPVKIETKPESNFTAARSDAGLVGGHVTDGALRISTSEVSPDMRGQGEGIKLYMALIDDALAKGLRVFSDATVEADAVHIYDALKRRGYDVRRLEGGALEDGAVYGKDAKQPAFEVVAAKPTPDLAAFIAEQGIKLPDVSAEAAPVRGNAFIAWLKEAGGVAWSQKTDIVGERGVRGNYAGIFTKNGQNLDTLVAAAEQAGYLSRADVENINDIGGTRALSELIRRATTGEKIKTADALDAAHLADLQARKLADDVDYMERELQALGVDTTAARGNADVLGAYLSEHRDALISRRLDDLNAETARDRASIGEEFNLTPKQVDEQSRIALASELDENAAYDAAVNSTDQVDYLNRIEEVIRNAPRGQEAARSSTSTAPDAGIPARDGQQAAATGFNPQAIANEAIQLLSDGRSPGEIISQMQAAGKAASPELQNMLIGVSEFGGRINDLVDQVNAIKAQRGTSAQPFDLIAQAVENMRSGTTVDAPKPPSAVESRLADMEVRNPTALDVEILVEFDESGKPTRSMPAREYLDAIKKEAAADAVDANLLEVAANCFLSGGI